VRWSILFKNGGYIFIYYGNDSGFWTDCTTSGSATNQSGLNMINAQYDSAADNRYETGANGGVYVTYADALAYAANQGVITDVILVVDGGWHADQVLTLGNVQIQTTLPTTDTFTPPSTSPTQTCTLPTAQIQVIKTSGSDPGTVNEVVSQSAADTTGYFRVIDCKYFYNLDVSSLPGAGGYTVEALINGTPATNPAKFLLK
jgi:hypothetical protein